MSVGNATQAVNFDRNDLTLVLGENLDLGGDDSGARNGTGKTTIINALSYALYGQALTNIRKDNLINKTNTKGMLVTIDFEIGGICYRIERGRKHNILKFYVNDVEQETKDDNSQGDSRETQQEIERLLGMSHDMFKHIVALNTYTEPFLSLKTIEQRTIIEQLLGITLLSEKAEAIKDLSKATRDAISQEEFRIKAVGDANKRIEEQIASLKRRSQMWSVKHSEDIAELEQSLVELLKLDVDAEIAAHAELALIEKTETELSGLATKAERAAKDLTRETNTVTKLAGEIEKLENHNCYACGQELHDEKQEQVLADKRALLTEHSDHLRECEVILAEIEKRVSEIGTISKKPKTFYADVKDAHNHRVTLDHLQKQLETKQVEQNPYSEQIVEMEEKGIEQISWDKVNELTRQRDHQEFLYKLLTNKDSFIRKKIIDQNLSYLNARLSYYLDKIGLPHTVVFQNDLTVEITELGRDLDFDNLSRGERNRLILSLSWAFRDVWESLYQPINLLFIDELIDSGMDTSGVENSLAILKKISRERSKSIWLVSHKDELAGRVTQILRVVKENGFTNYNTDVE